MRLLALREANKTVCEAERATQPRDGAAAGVLIVTLAQAYLKFLKGE